MNNDSRNEETPIRILVVLGGGGHTTETIKVVDLLGSEYAYSYLVPDYDQTSEGKISRTGPVYRATLPRGLHWNLAKTLKGPFLCSIQELWVLLRVRPKVILSGGAGIAIPIFVLGRICGMKTIYVESVCRIHDLSLTGKIVYHIAHLFFVQWEHLREKYPRAIYAGRLV